MRTFLTIAAMGTVAIGLFLVLIYFWQSSMILLPGIGGGASDVLEQCAPGSAEWRENGSYLGKVCEPAGPAKGTVILYHGNAGTIDDRAHLAAVLTGRGFRVALAEYPGYGKREGSATIRSVLAASLNDFGAARRKWPAPVYIFGESFGTGIAARIAAKHPEKVDGLVLITPWDSLANVVNAIFPLPLGFLLYERFDTVEALSKYPGKVVIVAAERDEVLPVGHARALAKAASHAAYLELPDAGHNTWPVFMTEKEWDWVMETLAKPQH